MLKNKSLKLCLAASVFLILLLFIIFKYVSPVELKSTTDLDKLNGKYIKVDGVIKNNHLLVGNSSIELYGWNLPTGKFTVYGIYENDKLEIFRIEK
jgi:hypothetical protein